MIDASPLPTSPQQLIVVLGDQLSPKISSLSRADRARTIVLMCEVAEETTYVQHHKKKIAFILSAMRHFAKQLRADGWQVDYVELDDESNTGTFTGEVRRAVDRHRPAGIVVTEPGEWRVREAMSQWSELTGLPVDIRDDDRFFTSRDQFAAWANDGRKELRMEFFYRELRRRTGYLMTGSEPAGGKWNYDHDNRKPAKADLFMPDVPRFEPDEITRSVIAIVGQRFATHIGDLEPFWFAVTREQARDALDNFIANVLPRFGDFQDAMLSGEKYLYHSILSPYINVGLLEPREVCDAAAKAYRDGQAPLNAVEGFIRQIIGWREYVRGIYWLKMPEYLERNFLGANRPLPDFYWTGDTDMACLKAAITQTIEEAYAHHIQRLMVTGNFAMLIGADPKAVHRWYLEVYADAYEWVELPNTLGMSQFADGGLLGSKPYAAGGNYINRMSDYCRTCRYDVRQRTGPAACPFNALYWSFLDRNRSKIGANHRLRQVYSTWDRMDPAAQSETLSSAQAFMATLKSYAE